MQFGQKIVKKIDVYKGIKQKTKYQTYIKAYIPDDKALDSYHAPRNQCIS